MKRNLFFILMALLPMVASAYDAEIKGIYYNFLGDEAVVTFSTMKYYGDVAIPKSVTYNGKTYSVTSIGKDAFRSCSGLTSITIPNSVTSIGESAFAYCSGQKSITISNGMTSIGEGAFRSYGGLKSVTIPNSVTSIGKDAFSGCEVLKSITIPESVTSIGEGAFSGCSSLTSIKVKKGNTKYDSRNNCNAIIETETNTLITGCQNTDIPGGVTSIGNRAFNGCRSLTFITIPKSVTSIGKEAFSYCSSLAYIKVETGNTKYDSRNDCNAIIETETNTLITGCWNTDVPESVTSFGDFAFSGCRGLKSVTIPKGMTSIGERVFFGCSGLKSVTIPENVTSIGEGAFKNCSSLTSIIIPESVTSIGEGAFYGCSGLTSITIPESVTSIGEGAFRSCRGLTSIKVETGNTKYDSRNDCNAIIETETNTLIAGCQNTVIPESVTSIINRAFEFCRALSSINIPNSVTSIGEYAFYHCSGPKSITIGNNVTSIGEDAFFGCSGLTSIKVETGNTKYDSRNDCNAIIETETNTLITGCKNTIIPESVTSIGKGAFYWCDLASINIPKSVTSIGENAFSSNMRPTSITIPESVTSIGKDAFSGCIQLTDVSCFADEVPQTDLNAFRFLEKILTLHVPAASINKYKAAKPWSDFGKIVAIEE